MLNDRKAEISEAVKKINDKWVVMISLVLIVGVGV